MAKFKIELQLKSTEENSPRILLTDFDSNNENNSGITFEETLTEEENDLYTLDFQIPHILENGLEVGNLIKVGRVLWLTLQDNRVIKMIITNFNIDEGDENWVYSVSAKDYASYVFSKTSVGLELDTFTDEDFWDWMEQKELELTIIENIGDYILDRSFLRDSDEIGWKVIDNGTSRIWNLNAYQLVENGDLALDSNDDGIPDGFFFSANAADRTLSNGVATFTATFRNGRFGQDVSLNTNDVIYYYARVKATSNLVYLFGVASLIDSEVYHSGNNEFEFLSNIQVASGLLNEITVGDSRTAGFTPISVDHMGAYNVSTMKRRGIKNDNGTPFTKLTNAQIKSQLDTWVQNNREIVGSIYNISVSNSNLYNALVELANISNRTFKIDYIEKQIIFYEKDDDQVYDKNYQLVDKLNIQDSSISYNGEELYGLFYVLGGTNLEDSYVFLQDETEYKDSFIYDFSYFKDAGLLSQEDIDDINGIFGITGYETPSSWDLPTLKDINKELQSVVGTLFTLESNLSLMEGRIRSHIENALGDGNMTKEEFQQVDAFFEYWAQEEEEYKIELKTTYFYNYDWSTEPIDAGLDEDAESANSDPYIRWYIPSLLNASFRYGNRITNIGVDLNNATIRIYYGDNIYYVDISTVDRNGFSPIYYGEQAKEKLPKIYYRVQGNDPTFQPELFQVISTKMQKTYKTVQPVLKGTMPYFELLYQIGGNELIEKKLEEIEKEINEYRELWIQDQTELELESVKTENKDENKIAMLTQRIQEYRLAIGEHRFDSQSKALDPTNQPGWITTLRQRYQYFLPRWEANFNIFRTNTLVLREQKRRLLQEKQNFWYTLKEKYGRSTFAEGYYENELELNSKNLMSQAKAIYESHKKPTEDFSITYVDISDIIGLDIDQIKVGDFIKIKKDKYNIQTNSYSKIKVSSISRTLREDANIELTINRVNLLDKLLEQIIARSQQ